MGLFYNYFFKQFFVFENKKIENTFDYYCERCFQIILFIYFFKNILKIIIKAIRMFKNKILNIKIIFKNIKNGLTTSQVYFCFYKILKNNFQKLFLKNYFGKIVTKIRPIFL